MSFVAQAGISNELLLRHKSAWQNMTQHSFLRMVADDSISDVQFARWLEQDYLFVEGLAKFIHALGSRMGQAMSDRISLAERALQAELSMFRQEASKYGANIDSAEIAPACVDYLKYLEQVISEAAPTMALLVYWTLEQAYIDGWTFVAQSSRSTGRYASFISNWTSPEFREFVDYLRQETDEAFRHLEVDAGSTDAVAELRLQAEQAFLNTVRCEYQFWETAFATHSWPL